MLVALKVMQIDPDTIEQKKVQSFYLQCRVIRAKPPLALLTSAMDDIILKILRKPLDFYHIDCPTFRLHDKM